MSGGELKKQVRKIIKNFEDEHAYGFPEVKQPLLKIVDEAKKEFPIKFMFSPYGEVAGIYRKVELIEEGKDNFDLLKDWVVKWFGEPEQ